MTDENDLRDEKNQMPGQYRKTVQKLEKKTIRRKGVMKEEGFKFFLIKVRSRKSKR